MEKNIVELGRQKGELLINEEDLQHFSTWKENNADALIPQFPSTSRTRQDGMGTKGGTVKSHEAGLPSADLLPPPPVASVLSIFKSTLPHFSHNSSQP